MKLKKLNLIPDAYEISLPIAVDGDTVRCMVHVGLGVMTSHRLRLKGFYAPEIAGRTPDLALAAKERLQAFLLANHLFIRTQGMRCDRYGRLVVELTWPDRPVTAPDVLGPLQMTVEAHRADVLAAKLNPLRSVLSDAREGGNFAPGF